MAQSEVFDINILVLQSIEKAFSRFGSSVSTVVYWKFCYSTKLKKEDIASRPDLFSQAIREIFRDGSIVIERAIIRELRTQFSLPGRNYKDIEDVMNSIRQSKQQ